MALTGCATVLALRLFVLFFSFMGGNRVSFRGILTASSLVSILVSVLTLSGVNFGILVLCSLTGNAKSCALSLVGATALLGFSLMGGITDLSLATVVLEVILSCSVFIGELLIGFSFTCSRTFGCLLRCGLGDGEGATVFIGLSRICLLISIDMLNFLLLSDLVSSGECSTLPTGFFSVEFRFSTALATMLALDDCFGGCRRYCTVCSALCNKTGNFIFTAVIIDLLL